MVISSSQLPTLRDRVRSPYRRRSRRRVTATVRPPVSCPAAGRPPPVARTARRRTRPSYRLSRRYPKAGWDLRRSKRQVPRNVPLIRFDQHNRPTLSVLNRYLHQHRHRTSSQTPDLQATMQASPPGQACRRGDSPSRRQVYHVLTWRNARCRGRLGHVLGTLKHSSVGVRVHVHSWVRMDVQMKARPR
jgi:hypothetical protein